MHLQFLLTISSEICLSKEVLHPHSIHTYPSYFFHDQHLFKTEGKPTPNQIAGPTENSCCHALETHFNAKKKVKCKGNKKHFFAK